MLASTWMIYGSSMIGKQKSNLNLVNVKFYADNSGGVLSNIVDIKINDIGTSYNAFSFYRARKLYNLSNHLGNVLTVISDKKIFNCNEKLVNATFENSNYNAFYNYGHFTDALTSNKLNVYANSTTNSGGETHAIDRILDKVGQPNVVYQVSFDLTLTGVTSSMFVVLMSSYNTTNTQEDSTIFTSSGHKTYTVTPTTNLYSLRFGSKTMGSTGSFSVDNFKIMRYDADSQFFTSEVIQAQDYSPFGAPLPNRNYSGGLVVSQTLTTDSFNGTTSSWVADGTHSVVSSFSGNLRAVITSRGSAGEGMKKTFTTVEAKQYRVRFILNTSNWPTLRITDSTSGKNIVNTGMEFQEKSGRKMYSPMPNV